ncbi:hypothetical protein Tco_0664512 [Tanacetum coccineum]
MTGGLLRGTPKENIGATPSGIFGNVFGSPSGGAPEVNVETPFVEATLFAREQIEGHISALRSLLKEHNGRGNVSPIRLSFDDGEDRTRVRTVVTGKEVGDADLKRPFKEANLSGRGIDGWVELRQRFTTRFSTRRACFKDPTKITKSVRKANETLVAFKERWIVETGFITGVTKVMKISLFMDAHKCLELAKRYSDKVPKTVDEIMNRLDDFVRSEEAFASTELPKGEASETPRKSTGPVSRREDRFHKGGYGADRRRNKGRSAFNNNDGLVPYHAQTPYQAPRDQEFHHPKVNLSLLTKLPKEILASELQLNLQPSRPMQLPPKKETKTNIMTIMERMDITPTTAFS